MPKLAQRMIVSGAVALLPALLGAQAPQPGPRAMATRAELQAVAASGEVTAAAVAQHRLTEGDFQSGDLIALTVLEEQTLNDTFAVRSGRTLQLPNLPEMSLRGVLRSELDSVMTAKIATYIRNPQVDAYALVRVAVLGAVGRPGFYSLPAETPVSDVVMIAGGPSNADLDKVELRRGQEVVLEEEAMSMALASGTSIDQLNVQGGDQIYVAQKGTGWRGVLQTAGLITGIFTSIYFATRIF